MLYEHVLELGSDGSKEFWCLIRDLQILILFSEVDYFILLCLKVRLLFKLVVYWYVREICKSVSWAEALWMIKLFHVSDFYIFFLG